MGIILVLLSAFCFALSSYYGKIVTNSAELSGVINAFSRVVLGSLIMFIYIIVKKKDFKATNFNTVFKRAIFNSFSLILLTASMKYTTITNANMLNMIYPVFVALLSPLFLGETIKKGSFFYMTMILLGSYLTANPNFNSINIGDALALVSALMAGFSMVYLKKASEEDDGYLIVFYVMLIGSIINVPFVFKSVLFVSSKIIIPLTMTGLLGFFGQVLLTEGYKYVDSATGALVSTSRIVMSGIIGYLFLNEPFTLRIAGGMILITLSLVGLSGYFSIKGSA